jgi:hypothetical protein
MPRERRTKRAGSAVRPRSVAKSSSKSCGHFAHKKKWQDAIGAFAGVEQWPVLREDEKQNADQ